MQRKMLLTLLFLFASIFPSEGHVEGHARGLLQENDGRVVVTSDSELQEAVAQLQVNQTILLDVLEIDLSRTLDINVLGVTIEGSRRRRTVLRCPSNPPRSALIVGERFVTIESVEFSDCSEESAVVVYPMVGARARQREITFEDVVFSQNGQGRRPDGGGGVRVERCLVEAEEQLVCRRPFLRFIACQFTGNRAYEGGGIYSRDADLYIQYSAFVDNEADSSGGAIYTNNSFPTELTIEDSIFQGNAALENEKNYITSPYGILATPMWMVGYSGTGGSIFLGNPFRATVNASRFISNRACGGGGAISIRRGALDQPMNRMGSFSILDCHFEDNQAFCGDQEEALEMQSAARNQEGGAIVYHSEDETNVTWTVDNSTFLRNRARLGGVLSLQADIFSPTHFIISSSRFEENIALVSGGAIFSVLTNVFVKSSNISNCRATYGGGINLWIGGMLFVKPDERYPSRITTIENCTAIMGGAIYADGAGLVDLQALTLRNNTAYRYGGGIRLTDIGSLPMMLRGVTIEGNRALVGGGLSVSAIVNVTITSDTGQPTIFESSQIDGGDRVTFTETGAKPTVFRNNTASVGGGMYYEPGHDLFIVMRIRSSHFVGNRALSLSHPEMQTLVEEGNTYEPYPQANVDVPNLTEQLNNFTLLSFLTDVDEGHGGGLTMTVENIRLFTIAEITFHNLLVEENEAAVGGGMSIFMTELYWARENVTDCFPAAFGMDTCQQVIFINVTVTNNSADYAGGVFSTYPQGIYLTCDVDAAPAMTAVDLAISHPTTPHDKLTSPYCTYVYGNWISDGADIEAVDTGSISHYLHVVDWEGGYLKEVASTDNLVVPCREDPENTTCSKQLRIAVRDVFNQTIVRGINDASLEVAIISDSVIGALRYTAVNGIVVIDNTLAWGINVTSNVTIVSERDRSIRTTLDLSTRACYPGEINQTNACGRCPSGQYSFSPDLDECQGCDPHANCTGGAALIPLDGFYHSNPFSPRFYKCIHLRACKLEGRDESLIAYYNDSQQVQRDLEQLNAYIQGTGPEPDFTSTYNQCNEGHEGILCGSCQDGYGHSFTGSCEACPEERSTRGMFIFLANGWLFLLIGANCAITLLSMNARVQLVRHELQKQKTHNRPKLQRAEHLPRFLKRSSRVIRERTVSSRSSNLEDIQTQMLLAHQLVATVQLTETLKILMNYLQVTSAAVHLQTDWNSILNGLLSAETVIVGFAGEVLKVPFECNFDDENNPASISALWIRLAIPLMVLVSLLLAFMLFYAANYLLHTRRVRHIREHLSPLAFTWERFFTCLIVIFVVSTYFSYIDVVRELLRAVNCVEIGKTDPSILDDHPYGMYSTEVIHERVWAEDTALVCYQGKHLPAGIVGLVGLFISFCGIVSIIVWLPLNRKRLTATEFVSRYWFLYQAYRKDWYTIPWESTILTRKSLIAAVIVFSVHLGPTLQASLCVGILLLAFILHSTFSPFKIPEDHEYIPEYAGSIFRVLHLPKLAPKWVKFNNSLHLNILEAASLSASVIVFYSAIILNDANSSSIGRAFMTAFAFVVNVLFLLFMLYRLYCGLHVLLDFKLDWLDAGYLATHANGLGFWNLIRKTIVLIRLARLRPQSSEDDDQIPIEQRLSHDLVGLAAWT